MVHEFFCSHGAVLALVAFGDTIYAGCQDGYVRVFDLETKTLVRTIIVQEVDSGFKEIIHPTFTYVRQGIDIIAMSMLGSDLYTSTANGWITVGMFYHYSIHLLIDIYIFSGGPRHLTALRRGKATTASFFHP